MNAIHVSLLREMKLNPDYADALERLGTGQHDVRVLGEKLLKEGPDALNARQRTLVMSDSEAISWLHRQVWLRTGETLSPWWGAAIRRYAR